MNRRKDMTKGKPLGLIISFALPLIIGNIGQQAYMIADTVIVGRGVGINALAALGVTDWLYWLVLWSAQAMTQGFAILITQNIGSGDKKAIRSSVTMSVYLCIVIGLAVSIIGPFTAGPLLRILDTPADIYSGAHSYLALMYAGIIIVMAYNMVSAILRSFGDGTTPLIAMIIAAVTNIGLDLLFVMVFNWGIIGAGVATLISQLISFLYCLFVIVRIPELKMERDDWRFQKRITIKLLKLGAPLVLQNVAIVLGGIVLQFVINGYGAVFIAGITATNKLYGVLESSGLSLGYATATYVAQNYGGQKIDRIKVGVRGAMKIGAVFSVIISITMSLFGRNLLSMFVSAKEDNAGQVLDVAYQYLIILSILLIILYFLHIYRSALQGLGNTIAPMISGFLECVGRIFVALALPELIGQMGVLLAEPTAWFLCAVYVTITFYLDMRKISKIEKNIKK